MQLFTIFSAVPRRHALVSAHGKGQAGLGDTFCRAACYRNTRSAGTARDINAVKARLGMFHCRAGQMPNRAPARAGTDVHMPIGGSCRCLLEDCMAQTNPTVRRRDSCRCIEASPWWPCTGCGSARSATSSAGLFGVWPAPTSIVAGACVSWAGRVLLQLEASSSALRMPEALSAQPTQLCRPAHSHSEMAPDARRFSRRERWQWRFRLSRVRFGLFTVSEHRHPVACLK